MLKRRGRESRVTAAGQCDGKSVPGPLRTQALNLAASLSCLCLGTEERPLHSQTLGSASRPGCCTQSCSKTGLCVTGQMGWAPCGSGSAPVHQCTHSAAAPWSSTMSWGQSLPLCLHTGAQAPWDYR